MAFWNEPANLDPKRAFRWKVSLLGDNSTSFLAKKVTKPQFTIEEAEHKFLNKSYYFPGHVKWDPVTVTMVDSSENSLVTKLKNAIASSGYITLGGGNIPESSTDPQYTTISKNALVRSTAQNGTELQIQQLDVNGTAIETWTLYNVWIKSIKPSELSYDTEDLSTYDIELRFDWAKIS